MNREDQGRELATDSIPEKPLEPTPLFSIKLGSIFFPTQLYSGSKNFCYLVSFLSSEHFWRCPCLQNSIWFPTPAPPPCPASEPGKSPLHITNTKTQRHLLFFLFGLIREFLESSVTVKLIRTMQQGHVCWTGLALNPLIGSSLWRVGRGWWWRKAQPYLGKPEKEGLTCFQVGDSKPPKSGVSPDNHVPSCLSTQKVPSWRHQNQEKEAQGRKA